MLLQKHFVYHITFKKLISTICLKGIHEESLDGKRVHLISIKIGLNKVIKVIEIIFEAKKKLVEYHEDVTIRKKPKEELLTADLFEFQIEEKARLIQEAVQKAEEERKKKELEIKLLEENERIEEALEGKNSLEVALSPLSIIDQGANVIKKLVDAIDDNSKTLEIFLSGRKDIPQDKIESLGNQLKEILENNEAKESEESINFLLIKINRWIGDFEDENEVFMENVKNSEHFGKLLKVFDQKQKDLVVRALIYYRNKKFGVKIDRGVGVSNFLSSSFKF